MKKLIMVALMAVASVFSASGDEFIFSADGITQGSGKRLLPSQGVNQKTGQIVLGLAGQTDEVRGQCGWYRVLPNPEVASNETFRVTNYVFNVAGTATPIGEIKLKPRYKTVTVYSKLKLYTAACKAGFWDNLKQYLQNTTTEDNINLYEAWTQAQDFNDDYPVFINALDAVKAQLMLDDETFNALLKECVSDTYQVLIDENGNEVSGSERKFRRSRAK